MRNILPVVLGAIFIIPDLYAMDLSLKDATDKIVAESNDLKSAEANIKKAKAQLSAVNANRWFSVDGTVSYTNLVDPIRPLDAEGVKIPSEIGAILNHSLPMPLTEDFPQVRWQTGTRRL